MISLWPGITWTGVDAVVRLPVTVDLVPLIAEAKALLALYDKGMNQVALQHPEDMTGPERFTAGIGRNPHELRFDVFAEEHRDGPIVQALLHFPLKLMRTRLMLMTPKSAYYVHRDPTWRVHIPLITSPDAMMIWPETSQVIHMPADGSIYVTDTTRLHTFINCDKEPRLHVVGAVVPF